MSVVLFALASLATSYLAWMALTGGAIAGCGPQSPCSRVLQTRWAYWFGIPVSLPALPAYLLLLFGTLRWIRQLRGSPKPAPGWLVALCVVVVAAATWFLLLQILVIRALCPYCLTAHLAAATAASVVWIQASRRRANPVSLRPPLHRKALLGGLLGLLVLISGQLLVTKQMNTVSAITAPSIVPTISAHPGRKLSLYNGRFQLDLNAVPKLGSAAAPHVAVALLDFTCSHCREMHELLAATHRRFGDRLAIVMLPVPLDATCNPLVQQTARENLNACDYARLALAVWQVKPELFGDFATWLFTPARPPAIELARQHVESLIGPIVLRDALASDAIRTQLKAGIELFEANSKRSGAWQMPQLMVGKALSVGEIQGVDGLYLMLDEQFGLK